MMLKVHIPFVEVERMNKIYYCHADPVGHHRHNFTQHFYSLAEIFLLQLWCTVPTCTDYMNINSPGTLVKYCIFNRAVYFLV